MVAFRHQNSMWDQNYQLSNIARPFYSRLHRVKLVIRISDASTQYLTAEMIYIKVAQ